MIIAYSPAVGPVPLNVILRESHSSDLTITKNPVEFGADVTDHAYVEPKKLSLDFADSGGALTYNALLRFQESRIPFNMISGLTIYRNMLIENMTAERDKDNANILRGTVNLSEIILVETAYAADSAGAQGVGGLPGGKDSTRSAVPSVGRAGDLFTADKVTGTVDLGDNAVKIVTDNSFLGQLGQ